MCPELPTKSFTCEICFTTSGGIRSGTSVTTSTTAAFSVAFGRINFAAIYFVGPFFVAVFLDFTAIASLSFVGTL